MFCDDHDCADCPGNKPGGPCYDAAEMAAEAEYWDTRCSDEEINKDAEEQQLIDIIEGDAAIQAEAMAEAAAEANLFNP